MLVLTGQVILQQPGDSLFYEVGLPIVGGMVLILLGLQQAVYSRFPSLAGRLEPLRRHIDPGRSPAPVYLAALLGAATAGAAAGHQALLRLPALALALWVGSIALALAASGRWPRLGRLSRADFAFVAVLLSLAIAVRVIRLGDIPWLLAGDEASVGLSAREFLQGGWSNPFRVAWYSFPSLFFVVPAASIGSLGATIEALRLPAALAGALTVAALFLYARAAFGRPAAYLASAYLAFFHFHVHFSRIALNNIWDPLFLTLFSWLVWKGWAHEDRSAFAWAGLTAGLGMYFYTSIRILLVLVPLWLVVAALRDRPKLRRTASGWIALALVMLVVFLPLAIFYLQHPNEFMAPIQRVSLLGNWMTSEVAQTGLPAWRILAERMVLSASAFTFTSLGHWYRIDHPMLLPLPATLFLLGSVVALWRAADLRMTWVLLWLAAGVAVGGLSESTPAAQRYIFLAPTVALVVALPLAEIVAGRSPRRNLMAAGAVGVLLAAILFDLRFYFSDYTPSRRFSDSNTEVAQTLGFFLRNSGLAEEEVEVFFAGSPRMGAGSIPTLAYLADGAQLFDLPTPLDVIPERGPDAPAVFAFLPHTLAGLEQIQQAYPGGQTSVQLAADGKELYTIYLVR